MAVVLHGEKVRIGPEKSRQILDKLTEIWEREHPGMTLVWSKEKADESA